jgi:hypothetical protein
VTLYEWTENAVSKKGTQPLASGDDAEASKGAGSSSGMDWALVELLSSNRLLKRNLLNVIQPALPTTASNAPINDHRKPLAIHGYMKIEHFEAREVVVCAGVSGWVSGVLDTVPAVVTIGKTDFSVRSIMLEKPLGEHLYF